jgi:acetyl esterase/lipase
MEAKMMNGRSLTPRFLLDHPYRTVNGKQICLDAVIVESSKPSPLVISIHGGGWLEGDKNSTSSILIKLVAEGISWVTIDYRLSGEATYPAQVEDCVYALQFVKSKAKEWNIDPERIALEGHSAGGHLSLWTALHPDQADPSSEDPVKRMSTKVRAVVSRAGPTDFFLLDKVSHEEALEAVYLFLGHEYDGNKEIGNQVGILGKEQLESVSPVTYVSKESPPVFMIHGTADSIVPVEHSKSLEKALRENGIECKTHYIEGNDHAAWYPGMDNDILDFLKRHLKRD